MLLFGEPHSNMDPEEREAVRENFEYAASGFGGRLRLADVAFLCNPPEFRKSSKAMRYRNDFGEEAATEKYAFIIDVWREMQNLDLVRDQLLHVLVAGRDSTASLLSWTMFHLARNPSILKRLQEEVVSAPTGDLTRDHILRLPFLRCCLKETLRLYPTLPMNLRFANKPTVLPRGGGAGGNSPVMLLPKGAGIAFSVYHIHRLESRHGQDSGIYRPQRWEDGELIKKARQCAGFIDFNAGPRLCLGKDFALMEASYALIRILQAYPDIKLAHGVPNEAVGVERHIYDWVDS